VNFPQYFKLFWLIATLIGFSRITENRHWATDVVAGGLPGFAGGTQVVNNYHRYPRLKRQQSIGLSKKNVSQHLFSNA
jgi:hypothetical protein